MNTTEKHQVLLRMNLTFCVNAIFYKVPTEPFQNYLGKQITVYFMPDGNISVMLPNDCNYEFTKVLVRNSKSILLVPEFDDDDEDSSCRCGVIGCRECDARYYEDECGKTSDGCLKAGTEECDFECPFS